MLHAFLVGSAPDPYAYFGVMFGPDGLLHGISDGVNGGGASFFVSPLGDQVAFGFDHNFGAPTDGKSPQDLSAVPASYFPGFVGATSAGGANGLGTAYALQPSSTGGSAFESVLASFGPSPDVQAPYNAPIAGTGAIHKGIYGCASKGGDHNLGGIYALRPNGASGLTESVIYSFGSHVFDAAGYSQYLACTLVQANSAGLLVGTTRNGGRYGGGTFYQLTPPATPGGAWTEQVDVSFDPANPAGFGPLGVPLQHGHQYFGALSATPGNSFGAIYQLTP